LKLYVYIIRRLLLLIPVIIGVTLITFYLSHINEYLLIVEYEGKIHTHARFLQVEQELHLYGPIYEQYLYYLGALFTGNWGFVSPGDIDPGTPVVTEFMMRFPPTAELALFATFLIMVLGIPLGVLSAVRKDRMADHITRLGAMTAVSIPIFWLGLLVLMMLSTTSPIPHYFNLLGTGQIDWSKFAFTPQGKLEPFVSPTGGLSRPTGFLLIDTLYYGDLPAFFDALWYLFWPSLVVALSVIGVVIRFMRSSMLENLGQDYIRTARSKGVPEQFVIKKHARRNALGSTTTIMGLIFAGLLAGVVVTETVFGWPGMGRWLYEAAYNNDMVSVMATTFVFTLVVVSANLIVDLFYSYLDPRVRLE
jgi:peptide/nickel transport system permease protein